jgi:hypothetical protein
MRQAQVLREELHDPESVSGWRHWLLNGDPIRLEQLADILAFDGPDSPTRTQVDRWSYRRCKGPCRERRDDRTDDRTYEGDDRTYEGPLTAPTPHWAAGLQILRYASAPHYTAQMMPIIPADSADDDVGAYECQDSIPVG